MVRRTSLCSVFMLRDVKVVRSSFVTCVHFLSDDIGLRPFYLISGQYMIWVTSADFLELFVLQLGAHTRQTDGQRDRQTKRRMRNNHLL